MGIRDIEDRDAGDVSAACLSLELLDGFRLQAGSATLDVSEMAQRLVALVALRRRPLHRAFVAGTLWPEKAESRAAANLRSILWRLNAAGPRPAIVCSGSCLALHPDVSLDVLLLEREGWALLDGSKGQVSDVRSDWFARELLPGWYDDWVIVERERLGQLQIRFLEALVHHLRRSCDFVRAIDHAMRLVAIDPLRERSQLALIHALTDEGSWGRAQWQADHYCQLLENAFGSGAATGFVREYGSLVPFDRLLAR